MNLIQLFKNIRPFVRPYRLLVLVTLILTLVGSMMQQVNAIVHATSVSALYDLLPSAADSGAQELAVQVGHFDQSREEVCDAVAQLQLQRVAAERGLSEEDLAELPEDEEPWQVCFYPEAGEAGIIEIILHKAEIEG